MGGYRVLPHRYHSADCSAISAHVRCARTHNQQNGAVAAVGIELDTPNGKNNGQIKSRKYFACAAKHGVLSVPERVTVLAVNRQASGAFGFDGSGDDDADADSFGNDGFADDDEDADSFGFE